MLICWSEHAWQDYIYWQKQDKTILEGVREVIIQAPICVSLD